MLAATGEQFEISGGGYRCVVAEGGACLRVLELDGVPLVDGFEADRMPSGGRGQLLMPWPNRVRDGRYRFDGTDLQLPLSEPARGNASHGLVRWCSWSLEEHAAHSVSLVYRLMAQTGYPWTLDLHVLYDLSADGLTVTQTATNLASTPAPYACGAHPYLTVGDGPVDGWELTLPASTRVLADDRKLPVGTEAVEGTAHDFRVARPIRDVVLDDAFTDLGRDASGRVEVRVSSEERTVVLWGGEGVSWLQAYTADDAAEPLRRRSLAVEPMTAPADAFNSGEGLVVLAPAGEPGDEHSVTWGIRAG